MRLLRMLLLGLAIGVAAGACGDDDTNPQNDAAPDGPVGPDAMPDGMGGQTFAQFVIDLVENQTSDTNEPATIDGRTFTDDPAPNTEDPTLFDSLF